MVLFGGFDVVGELLCEPLDRDLDRLDLEGKEDLDEYDKCNLEMKFNSTSRIWILKLMYTYFFLSLRSLSRNPPALRHLSLLLDLLLDRDLLCLSLPLDLDLFFGCDLLFLSLDLDLLLDRDLMFLSLDLDLRLDRDLLFLSLDLDLLLDRDLLLVSENSRKIMKDISTPLRTAGHSCPVVHE